MTAGRAFHLFSAQQRRPPRRPGGRLNLPALGAVLVATVALAGAAPAAGSVSHSPERANPAGAARVAAAKSAYDWPELHRNSRLTGYATNGTVSASNAASLGVHWATDLYSAMLDSPAVAYDSSLGETLAYIGTNNGNLYAINMATGAIVWDAHLPTPVIASPLVSHGVVWVADFGSPASTVYALNASTGAVQCTQKLPTRAYASPTAATPPGGTASVYFAAGKHVLSLSAANCSVQWKFTGKKTTWDPISYAVDATGEPLVLFGSADPVDSAYAVDANTGKQVWAYRTTTKRGDFDVGSGLTISPPGNNGFADGVAYVPGKDGYVYAVNLTTGAAIWTASMGSYQGTPNESLSTSALDGTSLVVGNLVGVTDLNPVTGKVKWRYQTPVNHQIVPPAPSEVVSSPAISGAPGRAVAAFGDVGGAFRVLSVATGHQLYSYQTGSWITSSPAVSGGNILIGSSDGYLYDLAAGSGNDKPATAVTWPASGAVVANPGGRLTVHGTASDGAGVAAVVVGVRQGGTDGMWWNASSSSWSAATVTERATLAKPGATSTGWRVSFQVPASGEAYRVDAYTVSADGPAAVPAAQDEFFVKPAAGGPTLSASAGFAGPGGVLSVHGSGFGPKERINVDLLGQTVGTGTSAADGSFTVSKVTVPASTGFGPTALVATGATSGKAAAAGLYVANSWPELGGGPGRTGFEPNDPVVEEAIDPADNIMLYPAWSFPAGAALTAPAVVDQVVYVGDQAGTLYALRARVGTRLWSWQTPDGAAITGAPAVDPAAGLAFVGAADGDLYAVHTSGASAGTLAWSASVGPGHVEAPGFDGTDVFAASDQGSVVALAEPTGSVAWSASAGAGVTGAPALDPAGRVLVVPTSAGLTALSTAGGGSLWNFALTGAAPPMLADGVVYVGSSDHDVYALSEATGRQDWSAATGGAIQDTGALSYSSSGAVNDLVVGSADGRIYSFNPANGAKGPSWSIGSSAVGLAIAGNSALATTSSQLVQGVRLGGSFVWTSDTGDGALSSPALVDGAFFVGGQKGTLWAFTPYGAPPP